MKREQNNSPCSAGLLNRILKYATLPGVSGDEGAIRTQIINDIAPHCTYEVDPLGNLICFQKGEHPAPTNKRLLISAHMDEVGLIVTGISEEGLLYFDTVGGIDPRVILGRAVTLSSSGRTGLIATKPIHLQSQKERQTVVPVDKLSIDIGATDQKQAEQWVQLGERATFDTTCERFGEGAIKGKALDDRLGCAILVEMMQTPCAFDRYFLFAVQEEIGLRGAKVAAYTINPDLAIVVEGTTANDLPGVAEHQRVCSLRKGAVVGFMDRSTIYDQGLLSLAREIAATEQIPIQTKNMVAGGNDSGAIHLSRGGVRTLAVSAPCRYLHSGVTVTTEEDLLAVHALVTKLAEQLQQVELSPH